MYKLAVNYNVLYIIRGLNLLICGVENEGCRKKGLPFEYLKKNS